MWHLTAVLQMAPKHRGTFPDRNCFICRDRIFALSVGRILHVCARLFRDDGLLPAGVEVVGGSLAFPGQVGLQHAGLYDCWVSYHHVRAGLMINITVKPQAVQLGKWTIFRISSISHSKGRLTSNPPHLSAPSPHSSPGG